MKKMTLQSFLGFCFKHQEIEVYARNNSKLFEGYPEDCNLDCYVIDFNATQKGIVVIRVEN